MDANCTQPMAYDMLLPEMHGSIMGFDGFGCTTDVDNMSACGKGAERSVSAIRYFAEYLWQVTLSCQKALHKCFLALTLGSGCSRSMIIILEII